MTFTVRHDSKSTRKAQTVLALLAAVILLVALMPSPANATYSRTVQNNNTGRCLTWNWVESAVGTTCRSLSSQWWDTTAWGDGTWQLRVVAASDGRCLDDSYAYGLRVFHPCWPGWSEYSRYQSWYYVATPGGYAWKNQATGRCLDDSFAYGVRTFTCNGTSFQGWS
jgi:hypothetical protein